MCRLFGSVEYGYDATASTAGTVIGDTLSKSVGIDGWYTLIPSVIYNWAQGSLQQSASKGIIRDWRLPELLRLGARLLKGLNRIHGRGLLHADIRPANVMYQMRGDDPDGYHLIDYGSFGKDGQSIGTGMAGDPDRHSLLGPIDDAATLLAILRPRAARVI